MIKQLDPEYLLAHPNRKREAMMWMNDHGIDPNNVAMDAAMEFLDEGRIEIEVWEPNKGKRWLEVKGTYPFPMDCLMDMVV